MKKPPQKNVGGARKALLVRAGARLRQLGHGAAEIFATISAVNAERCDPPLEEAVLRTIADSTARRSAAADAKGHAPRSLIVDGAPAAPRGASVSGGIAL